MPGFIPSIQVEVPIIVTFNKATKTVIEYGPELQSVLGQYPTVQVCYLDKVKKEYVMSNLPSSRIVFADDKITIFHGGEESGFVKVF